MDAELSNLVWIAAAIGAAGILLLVVCGVCASHRRSVVRNGVKIEIHGAHRIDDLVIEWVWRTTISMTNRSRVPRRIPVLASRATVTAGRKTYLAQVFLERMADELSPDEVIIAQVDFVLPVGIAPQRVTLQDLAGRGGMGLRVAPANRGTATMSTVTG